MILIYTGNGKGKTSACVGQAIRAHGQGLRVAFGQFMKEPGQAGEQKVLGELLGDRFFVAGGKGFFRREETRDEHRAAAEAVLAWVKTVIDSVDMLVLDESIYALGSKLLLEDELRAILAAAREKNFHLVLAGRNVPEWLVGEVDLVTSMTEVKHPYASGHTATKGIEF